MESVEISKYNIQIMVHMEDQVEIQLQYSSETLRNVWCLSDYPGMAERKTSTTLYSSQNYWIWINNPE